MNVSPPFDLLLSSPIFTRYALSVSRRIFPKIAKYTKKQLWTANMTRVRFVYYFDLVSTSLDEYNNNNNIRIAVPNKKVVPDEFFLSFSFSFSEAAVPLYIMSLA